MDTLADDDFLLFLAECLTILFEASDLHYQLSVAKSGVTEVLPCLRFTRQVLDTVCSWRATCEYQCNHANGANSANSAIHGNVLTLPNNDSSCHCREVSLFQGLWCIKKHCLWCQVVPSGARSSAALSQPPVDSKASHET